MCVSHYDSTVANDMSDRHGHKSNLRPFICGTPAEDAGEGVVGIMSVHFSFSYVGHASECEHAVGHSFSSGESSNSFSRAKGRASVSAHTGDGLPLSFIRVEK